MSLTVHCYLWREVGGRDYRPEHVATLARMVKRHLTAPHRFICITDEPGDYGADVDVVPLPEEALALAEIRTPEGAQFPSSYRRLWSFSREAAVLGERLLMLDVDCVITGDITPLVERDDDFTGWRPRRAWGRDQKRLGGGTWLLRAGSKAQVWDTFRTDPMRAIQRAREAGHRGSDQAILSWMLYDEQHIWPADCGIYASQDMLRPSRHAVLPRDARIVHFNGHSKPWACKRIPWVAEHYR